MTATRAKLGRQHVYVVDDDPSVRNALARALLHLDFEVQEFSDPRQFLDKAVCFRPAVLVIDMRMPKMSGVQLQEQLSDKGWPVPVIFISGESTVAQSITAMRQGAYEFLTKPFDLDHLVRLIDEAMQLDHNYVQAQVRRQECQRQLELLKPRELQALHLLSKGYSNQELMRDMDISLPTAKQYRAAVMRKLHFESLAQLIAFCEQLAPPRP